MRFRNSLGEEMRKLIDENINTQKLLRIACLLLADIVIINLSAVAALLLRFELSPAQASEAGFMSSVISYMWLNTLVTVIIFWIFGLYNSLWEFAGVHELVRIALASACPARRCGSVCCFRVEHGIYAF